MAHFSQAPTLSSPTLHYDVSGLILGVLVALLVLLVALLAVGALAFRNYELTSSSDDSGDGAPLGGGDRSDRGRGHVHDAQVIGRLRRGRAQ